MIRRRPVPLADSSANPSHDNNDDDDDGKSKPATTLHSSDSSSSMHSHSHNQQVKPILPHWLVFAIVVFFLSAGFFQHHWTKSRDLLAAHPAAAAAAVSASVSASTRSKTSSSSSSEQSVSKSEERFSLLTEQEDAALEIDAATGLRYHLVFSTDCSAYQHWQSYLVFFTAMQVRQPGHVTRIASGCDKQDAAAMQTWFDHEIKALSHRFHLQLTPHFSDIKDSHGNTVGDYKFFNKPFGLKYWMEHSPQLQYRKDTNDFDATLNTDVVILIDPDMGLLRPITADFTHDRETIISSFRLEHDLIARKVAPGKPFAQVYGFGTQWQRLDLHKIAGPDSPAATVSPLDARLYYPVGPPYLATVPDMHRIAVTWSAFVPAVYEQYPHLLAEMFAYCIAAAHLQLPHQLIDSLMISATDAGGEGWPLIDAIPAATVCAFAKTIRHSEYAVPNVVHLCQRYIMGDEWFFSKRKVPADIYDCNVPLFKEPPDDLAVQFDFKQAPGGNKKRTQLSPQQAAREAFMLCYLHAVVNQAATFYKKHACQGGSTMNLEKTRSLVELFSETENVAKRK